MPEARRLRYPVSIVMFIRGWMTDDMPGHVSGMTVTSYYYSLLRPWMISLNRLTSAAGSAAR